MERKSIYTDDQVKLTYYTSLPVDAAAPTVVCVSPVQGVQWWQPLVEQMRDELRFVVAIVREFPDCERELSDDQCAFENHAEDLRRMLAAEGLERAHFFGWCFGAKIMLDYYRRFPELVCSMIGLGVPFYAYPSLFKPLLQHRRAKNIARIIGFIRKYSIQLSGAQQWGANSPVGRILSTDQQTHSFYTDFMSMFGTGMKYQHLLLDFARDEVAIHNILRISDHLTEADTTEILASVAVPMLMLQGSADDVVPTNDQTEAFLASNKNIIYRTLDRESHYLLLENPRRVGDCLREFLRS